MKCPQKVSFLCLTFWGQYIFGRLFFFVYLEFLVEKCKYNIKDRKKNFFVVKVMEARELASITGKTPRRFHRLTHDRNKIWYYTYIREQY